MGYKRKAFTMLLMLNADVVTTLLSSYQHSDPAVAH
jgi:hypothetical protein